MIVNAFVSSCTQLVRRHVPGVLMLIVSSPPSVIPPALAGNSIPSPHACRVMDVGLGLGPPRGPLGYEPDDGLPQADPLPDGWVEHRLQVDRKRLEAMITGNPLHGTGLYLQNADEFFRKVQEMSEAVVCWPSKLKIGAKTKKDPFVKILGLPHQVEVAAQLIAAKLQVKRDRVTLKMEIVHSAHSHIIGKGGRGSQTVMRHTGCHVHFPDGNKYSEDLTKSDQVSIAGPAAQVEQARRLLRDLCPVIIQLEVPYLAAHPPMFPPVSPTVNIMWKKVLPTDLYAARLRRE
ncbi:unnamed protein product, partial [Mesorhabditis spiculigera]